MFAVGASQSQRSDRSYYKSLYTFDANQELAEYTLPVLSNQIPKSGPGVINATQLAPIRSEQSRMQDIMEEMAGEYGMEEMPNPREVPQYNEEEYDDEEEEMDTVPQGGNDAEPTFDEFTKIIETEGTTSNQTTELRKANFIRKGTASWHIVQNIRTGDQAISFFAKHGTNMPVKFLNCNRRPVPAAGYRPYDLVVEEDEKKLDREYYTISAQGVVLVQNERKRRRAGARSNPAPTEFLTLSEWMQQSTMFNVLTSMKFFKYYLITKVFSLWKGNVRFRIFDKTRQQLAATLIQARPDYQPTFMEILRLLYEMQQKKTFAIFQHQKNYEIEEYNSEQLKERNMAKSNYNEKVEDIISKRLQNLVDSVSNSRTISDAEDLENSKIGQANKNKSMVVQKMEDALKNRVIKLAWLNYNHLGTFIRLVDYMVVETQVRINLESAQLILIEMDREDRKYNLQTTVGFDSSAEDGLKYDPTKIDIENNLEKLLDEMQEVTAEIQRVINHSEFHQFISGLITDSGPRFKTIVEESDDYKETRAKITERI